jgi:hypothetical protein
MTYKKGGASRAALSFAAVAIAYKCAVLALALGGNMEGGNGCVLVIYI